MSVLSVQAERFVPPSLFATDAAPRTDAFSFDDAMAQAAGGDKSDIEAKVREAATQFVASAFIMPVLEARHESPFAVEPFKENSAQQRFAPMLDWQFADRIASAGNFSIVDAIVKRMMQGIEGGAVEAANGSKGSIDVSG